MNNERETKIRPGSQSITSDVRRFTGFVTISEYGYLNTGKSINDWVRKRASQHIEALMRNGVRSFFNITWRKMEQVETSHTYMIEFDYIVPIGSDPDQLELSLED
jgi:hypothetical protein